MGKTLLISECITKYKKDHEDRGYVEKEEMLEHLRKMGVDVVEVRNTERNQNISYVVNANGNSADVIDYINTKTRYEIQFEGENAIPAVS